MASLPDFGRLFLKNADLEEHLESKSRQPFVQPPTCQAYQRTRAHNYLPQDYKTITLGKTIIILIFTGKCKGRKTRWLFR